jgi:hypothetical protein
VVKPEGNIPLERPKNRWEDNIEIDLNYSVCGLDSTPLVCAPLSGSCKLQWTLRFGVGVWFLDHQLWRKDEELSDLCRRWKGMENVVTGAACFLYCVTCKDVPGIFKHHTMKTHRELSYGATPFWSWLQGGGKWSASRIFCLAPVTPPSGGLRIIQSQDIRSSARTLNLVTSSYGAEFRKSPLWSLGANSCSYHLLRVRVWWSKVKLKRRAAC